MGTGLVNKASVMNAAFDSGRRFSPWAVIPSMSQLAVAVTLISLLGLVAHASGSDGCARRIGRQIRLRARIRHAQQSKQNPPHREIV